MKENLYSVSSWARESRAPLESLENAFAFLHYNLEARSMNSERAEQGPHFTTALCLRTGRSPENSRWQHRLY